MRDSPALDSSKMGLVDPERAAILVEGYLAGLTMREVAARHRVNTKAVQRAMRQMGAQTRTPQERTGAPARVEQWAASYAQGVSTAEVAAQASVDQPLQVADQGQTPSLRDV